ncbi:MAG: hypothetical protein ABI640_16915 [Gammaproteobacteria bacterium]
MRTLLAMLCLCAASALTSARAQSEASPAVQQPAVPPTGRLTLSANGSTLSSADSGRGASIGWLRFLGSDALIGLSVEHQSIADAQWTFASVTGAVSHTSAGGRKLTFQGEVQRGSGDEGGRSFSYRSTSAGITRAVTDRVSLRFESREIDIDRTHGNLPRLGLSVVWNAHFLTDVAYARSVSGNLGTELVSTRTDYYGARFKLLFGAAFGEAAPSVVNLQPGLALPDNSNLREAFFGVSKPLAHGEFLAVVDHLALGGNERSTLTISYAIPLRGETRSHR